MALKFNPYRRGSKLLLLFTDRSPLKKSELQGTALKKKVFEACSIRSNKIFVKINALGK